MQWGQCSKLAEVGRDGDTIVIVSAEHGDFMGDHGLLLKGLLHFQPPIRIPFLWRDPMRRTVTSTSALASTVDIACTIFNRAGHSCYNGMQGNDLGPVMETGAAWREAILIEEDSTLTRSSRFRFAATLAYAVTQRHRLSIYLDTNWDELYYLEADPLECRNLFDDPACQSLRSRLIRQLANEMMRAVDRGPWPRWAA